MFAMAIHRVHSIFVAILKPASLLLVCSFLLVASARNAQSAPRQSRIDRHMQLHGPVRGKPQAQGGISQRAPASPKFHKNRSATARAADATATQLFLEPSEPQYSTGVSPYSLAVADFNGDGRPDLASANLSDSVSVLLGDGDGTFQPHVDYQTGPGAFSVVVADFNGDAKPDIAVTNSSGNSVSVLLGNGDGTFQAHVDYPTVYPHSMALGDFNGDGKPDLAVTNLSDYSVGVLIGNGDGTFQTPVDYQTGAVPLSVAVGDFNGDGKLDLATANNASDSLSVLLGNGDGSFQMHVDYPIGNWPDAVAVGDFNRDGKLDLAVCDNRYAGSVSVLLGNGDGTFQPYVDYATGGHFSSVAIADFNGDNQVDIAVSNYDNNTVSVLLGNGNGTFQPYVDYMVGSGPMWVAVGDFNGDSKADLAIANQSSSSVSILVGKGDGTFQDPRLHYRTGYNPRSLAVGDFNSDARPDLAVTNSADNTVSVLLGNGDGTFQTHVDYPAGAYPDSLAIGDFNGDGKADLAIASYPNAVSVLLGNGNGTFQTQVEYLTGGDFAGSVAVGDFNGDGKLDLGVTNSTEMTIDYRVSSSVSVLLGNGDGTFQTHGEYPISDYLGAGGLTVGDFNADSRLDLAVVNGGYWAGTFLGSVGVLLGNGDGTFQPYVEYGTGRLTTSVAVGDFNGDGKLDLVVSNASDYCDHCSNQPARVSVLLGNGDGTFGTRLDYVLSINFPMSLAVSDFNGDGKPDLAMLSEEDGITVLLGKGDGTFEANKNYASGQSYLAATAADFNGDGAQDLAFITPGNGVSILLNIWRDFGVSASPASAMLRAGSSAAFTLTTMPMNGFNGAVLLSCSVSPAPALAPTCSLNPASVTPTASGTVTAQLSVATTGPTASLVHPVFPRDSSPIFVLWLPICGLAVMGTGLTCRLKRKNIILGALLLTLLLAGLWACGGSNSSTLAYRQTPPGKYTVTVNAASGSITHSTAVTITVQ